MMKGLKKGLALLLGTAMLTGLLAGCGSEGSGESSVENTSQVSDSAAEGSTGTTENQGNDSAVDTSEYVELKMYLVGDKPEDFDDVYAEVNKILLEKLNCTITVDWLSWAEHGTNYSLLFSGGEKFDLIYTATSWCHYEQTVGLGGFRALDQEFIETYAPDVLAMLPEVAWQQATINGSIYMVPANFVEVSPDVFAIRGDWMEEYGYEDISSIEELIAFFKDCAADGRYGNPNGGFYWNWFQSLGYSTVSGAPSNGQLVLYHANDPSDTSFAYALDWDKFSEYCHIAKELADAGAWPNDILNTTQDRQDGLLNGRGAAMVWNAGSCRTYANQANAEHPDWKVNLYNVIPDVAYTATKYINGGMAINIASENPERAMMVINEFATNRDIQDLTQLGIEGVHWNPVGDDQYEIVEGNAYNTSNNWGWRNLDIRRTQYQANPTDVDLKTQELEAYFMAHIKEDHILDGFAFDPSNVSTQFAAVEAAMATYFDPLVNGLVADVDASLEQFRTAIEAAGVQDVLDEMQKQADAFIEANQ